jgi:hypothetical protein
VVSLRLSPDDPCRSFHPGKSFVNHLKPVSLALFPRLDIGQLVLNVLKVRLKTADPPACLSKKHDARNDESDNKKNFPYSDPWLEFYQSIAPLEMPEET